MADPAQAVTHDQVTNEAEPFRLLVQSIADYAVFMLDADGRVVTWNLGAQLIKGYTAEEIVGRHFSVFYTPEDREAGRPEFLLSKARDHGRYEDVGWRVRKDGSQFWADVVVTVLRDPAGAVRGFAKVTRDLTAVRNAEAREMLLALEQQARATAEEALAARDRFLSIASHELRTPVASIQLTAQAMLAAQERGTLTEERLSTSLRRMEAATQRMGRLVDDLLDVTRLRLGVMPLRPEPMQLDRLIRDVVAGFEDHAHRIRLDLPAECSIGADPARIEQVVTNLLDNAIKYSTGGPIDVHLSSGDEGALFEVRDEGIGLEDTTSIFQPFGRSSTARDAEGLGLGLYIAKQLVEQHGGRIWATSQGPAAGATFSVWLPAVAAGGPE